MTTPFANTLTLTALTPTTVQHVGGEEVVLSGTFPDGPYDVFVLTQAGERRCYPADRGTALECFPDDGAQLRIIVPPLPKGERPYSISVRHVDGARFDMSNVLFVEHATFAKKVYDLRGILPPRWETSTRSLLEEPLFDGSLSTVNLAPAPDPIPDQEVESGTTANVQPTLQDADGAPAPYVWGFAPHSTPVPAWITIHPDTGLLSISPNEEATVTGVVVQVFDGEVITYFPAFNVTALPAAPTVQDALHTVLLALSTQPDTAGVVENYGELVLNGVSYGQCDVCITSGALTFSGGNPFNASSYFSAVADARPALWVHKGTLTVEPGQVVKPAVRKLFFAALVNADLVLNGEWSMSARGANHGGVIASTEIPLFAGNCGGVTNPVVPAAGADGGPYTYNSGPQTPPAAGVNGQTGGGGGCHAWDSGGAVAARPGAPGTSFTGGSGAGGSLGAQGTGPNTAPTPDGGAGGPGAGSTSAAVGESGGAGNPGGYPRGQGNVQWGGTGTGGVIYLAVLGTFSGAGLVSAVGSPGGSIVNQSNGAPGSGSGGGSINIAARTSTFTGTISAAGGAAGTSNNRAGHPGGRGTERLMVGGAV